ncbi:MAG: aminopeptidase [Clostridiales bacterium]|nr:aminopeptidase [Clostridiales bacterium]
MSEEMKELKKKLLATEKNGYDTISEADTAAMEDYCASYKSFLNNGKTERECAGEAMRLAELSGFVPYHRGMNVKPGDKIYSCNRDKGVMLAVIGTESLARGAQIAAAHIDSPRLDLKPNPLYEEGELAYFKTHYYGGLRKYQWVTIPLELHGVVALRSGEVVRVSLGAKEGESQFVITDLLPHLGGEQGKKPLNEAITGESLNILLGSQPMGESDDTDRTRLQIMKLLNEKYGITEDDFTSAELEAVPAGKAVDIGLDRSLIGSYGHDDRVCGYAALHAILELAHPTKTAVCMLADKEEIGSMGVTGMQSAAFDTFMHDLCEGQGVLLRECYENSFCLSADVTAAFDPNFADVFEKKNAARVNHGMGLCKYTGARGKSGASDACAETVAYIRRVLDKAGVIWQIAELGKVDAGGGGTVAMYMANRNIETLDAGVPVLSMHAPFEVVAKLDCYMTYKGCKAVFEAE